MALSPNRMIVRGSEHVSMPGARAVGPVPNDERFEVTVRVRARLLSKAQPQTASKPTNFLASVAI
jgi:hypothetical protein